MPGGYTSVDRGHVSDLCQNFCTQQHTSSGTARRKSSEHSGRTLKEIVPLLSNSIFLLFTLGLRKLRGLGRSLRSGSSSDWQK